MSTEAHMLRTVVNRGELLNNKELASKFETIAGDAPPKWSEIRLNLVPPAFESFGLTFAMSTKVIGTTHATANNDSQFSDF